MKLYALVNLHKKLSMVKGLNGFEAKLIVRKNLGKMQIEVDALALQEKENIELTSDYDKEVNGLYKQFSGGKVTNGIYTVPDEKLEDFLKAVDVSKEKHKAAIDAREKKEKDFLKFLKEKDSEFTDPFKIPLTLIEKYESPVFDEKGVIVRPGISEENLEYIYDIIDTEK